MINREYCCCCEYARSDSGDGRELCYVRTGGDGSDFILASFGLNCRAASLAARQF